MFRRKYIISSYYKLKNKPYCDAYFCIKRKGKRSYESYEYENIWTKSDVLDKLLTKKYLEKQDILNACEFETQRTDLMKKI